MAYLISIPISKSKNLTLLKDENIWGFKKSDPSIIDIKTGTKLIFVYGMKYLGKNLPKGFPRLSTYKNLSLEFKEILLAEVLKKPAEVKDEFPFGQKYQLIVPVKINKKLSNIKSQELSFDIIEAVRKMNVGQHNIQYVKNSSIELLQNRT